jgi:hypothetical protein
MTSSSTKVKGAINWTADKAKEMVDGAQDIVDTGTKKAKNMTINIGKKVKDTGEKIEKKGK